MNDPVRSLPHSLEAEENLLGVCFVDGSEVVSKCTLAGVTPLSFYSPAHGIVFGVIVDLYLAQRPIEPNVVAEELKTLRQLDAVGGYAFVAQVSRRVSTTAQASYFIGKVRELETLRTVIRACTGAVESCYGFDGDLNGLMSGIGAQVMKATGHGNDQTEETFQAVAAQLLVDAETPVIDRKLVSGHVSWGLIDVDAACGKMAPSNLVVLAGMPSTGKSALADQVAWGNAASGSHTLMFTFEMTKAEKVQRMAQQISGLNFDHFDRAPMDRKLQYTEALRTIKDCRTLHVFERDTSVNRIISRVRTFENRGNKIGLVVVDFLQYLARREPYVGKERTDEKIGRITAAMKEIARDCACPVMLLSSLNREGYRDGNRPTMASLKASGDIESDADVLQILHWPKENPRTRENQDPHDAGVNHFFVELNQEKGRSKGVHQIGLVFDRQATRFNNLQK